MNNDIDPAGALAIVGGVIAMVWFVAEAVWRLRA